MCLYEQKSDTGSRYIAQSVMSWERPCVKEIVWTARERYITSVSSASWRLAGGWVQFRMYGWA